MCEEKFPLVGDWEQFIHPVVAMLSSIIDEELLDSRKRQPPSCNGPTLSVGTYHIENLREIF